MMEDIETPDSVAPMPGARPVPLVSSVPAVSVPVAPPVRGPISVLSVNGRLPDRSGNVFVPGISPETIDGKADKSTTYTKTEVDAIVAAVKTGSRQIVASLASVTDPQPLVIYMVAKSTAQTNNTYDEYIYITVDNVGKWEKIGDTEIGLSGYARTASLAAVATSGSYNDLSGKPTIPAAVSVDSALSGSSENPVQNKVVTAALNGKATTAQGAKADAALSRAEAVAGFTEWVCNPAMIGDERVYIEWDGNYWIPTNGGGKSGLVNGNATSTNLAWEANDWWGGVPLTATRTRLPTMADIPTKTSNLTNDSGFLTSHQDITGKEDKSNKTASFSQTPGDVKYPTEKLLKDSLDANAAAHRYALNMAEPDVTYTAWSVSPSTYRLVFYGGQWLPVDTVYTGDYFPGQESGDPAGDENSTSLSWATGDPEAPGAVEAITATRTPTGASVTLQDRAINVVSLSTTATMTMPAAISGHARDLVVRLIVGAADLNITWGTADAGGAAVDYETEDGEFPDLSEAGTYLVRLTETAAFAAGTGGAADTPAKFLIQCQPLQTAAGGAA